MVSCQPRFPCHVWTSLRLGPVASLLRARGYSEENITAILSENSLRTALP